jgi:hypothetical protein
MVAFLIVLASFSLVVFAIKVLFWIIDIFFSVCGLLFAILISFGYGGVDYTQERTDSRQAMSAIHAMEIAEAHEYEEDERVNRLVESVKRKQEKGVDNDSSLVNNTDIYLQQFKYVCL